tara:strand:+ start:52 stop:180 length:129 start_codon:yes stop_codon:yes gene_type:complete
MSKELEVMYEEDKIKELEDKIEELEDKIKEYIFLMKNPSLWL